MVCPSYPWVRSSYGERTSYETDDLNLNNLNQVIPFGPYLDDDFNYEQLNYVRLFAQARADSIMITLKASRSSCFQIVIGLLCNFSFEFPFRSSLHAF